MTTIFVPEINVWTPEWEWPEWMKRRRDEIVIATGVYGGAFVETVTLSGTSGTPNTSTDNETVPTDALAGWRFMTDGTVDRIVSDIWQQFQDGTEWIDSQDNPVGSYWIKATLDSGDTPNGGGSSLMDTWLSFGTQHQWTWLENSDPLNEATTAGTIQVDISNESDGTPILDTGFYRGTATQFGTA